MCFFSKRSRYLVSVNPVVNLMRISAVPAVFSVSSVFHKVYEVFYSRIKQCRLLHTFSGSKFPTQFLNFSSNFKNPAYKFQISAKISNFRTKFLVPSTKFHRVTDPSKVSGLINTRGCITTTGTTTEQILPTASLVKQHIVMSKIN